MGDYEADERIRATADELFDYLSDVDNLPHYFARITAAEPTDDDAVHVTAKLPSGDVVGARRGSRSITRTRRSRGGQRAPITITAISRSPGSATTRAVAVTVSTTRVEGDRIQQGVQETVELIKKQVEEAHPREEFDASWSGPMKEPY